LRRSLRALGLFAVLSAVLAAPAFADHGRRWDKHRRGHHHGRHFPFPAPRVIVGLPAPVIVIGGRHRDYDYDYDRRYDRGARAYDRGYEDGYEDGYDDRDREEWRRAHYRRHRHHRDCDHDYYY
jgi:hypothetical protein